LSSLTSRLASLDRRAYVAVAVVAILLILAVGGTLGYAAYQDRQPSQPSLNLKDGQKEVSLTQKLVLTLKRPAAVPAVTAHFHVSPAVDGHLEASSDRRTFTWSSAGPWNDLTQYTVHFEQTPDDRSIPIRAATWRFTTTIVPRVVALTTDTGTAIADNAELPVGSALKIAFNAVMDAASVKVNGNGNSLPLTWETDGKTADFATKGIPVGALALTLAPGGHDTLGHALSIDWTVTANLVFRVNVHTTPLRFPALIQVPNDPGAWDQSGLQSADMVFEYATEGGIPRFTAVFTNVPDKVGPVRSATYSFDSATKTYDKSESGHKFGDASVGQPLRISMLIVLRTQVTTTGIIEDVNGAHGLDYNIDGSGSADVYYQGQKYSAKWSSPDRSSPLVFTNDSGQPITLPSGLVWIDVVPG
jgi:Protein of unknown function (DUF3048) N-terminal domain/Protein of unknown function (DUF3048) C-terminal domain